MTGETQFGHAEFEALLAEAVEGSLSEAQMAQVRQHAASCPPCSAMFAEALEGYQMLEALPEVDAPAYLVHNILVATSGVEPSRAATTVKAGLRERFFAWLVPATRVIMQPRFAGSLAMGFFSLMFLLNAGGVRIGGIKKVDLRPGSLRSNLVRQYYETSARVAKYYDGMRFVYEMQSRVRDLRDAALPDQNNNSKPEDQKKPKRENKNISDQPGEKQNQNYSRQTPDFMLAKQSFSGRPSPHILTQRSIHKA